MPSCESRGHGLSDHPTHMNNAIPRDCITPLERRRNGLKLGAFKRAKQSILPWVNRLVAAKVPTSCRHSRGWFLRSHPSITGCAKSRDKSPATVPMKYQRSQKWAATDRASTRPRTNINLPTLLARGILPCARPASGRNCCNHPILPAVPHRNHMKWTERISRKAIRPRTQPRQPHAIKCGGQRHQRFGRRPVRRPRNWSASHPSQQF